MAIDFVNGKGTPRLMRILGKRVGWIVGSSWDGTLSTLTTPKAHGMFYGQSVQISGSALSFDGLYTIASVPAPNQFTIAFNAGGNETKASFASIPDIYQSSTSTVFTATTAQDAGQTLDMIHEGYRIKATLANAGGVALDTFGKVLTASGDTITLDAWTNGTPANGTQFVIDGWVVDPPRTEELIESFDPSMLVHELYDSEFGSREETKFRGWKYHVSLDYSHYLGADDLTALAPIFAAKGDDNLIVQPRRDAGFYYNVYFEKTIEMRKLPRSGYARMSFVFKAKENIPSLPIELGYGTGYAENFGSGL